MLPDGGFDLERSEVGAEVGTGVLVGGGGGVIWGSPSVCRLLVSTVTNEVQHVSLGAWRCTSSQLPSALRPTKSTCSP